MPVRDPKTPSLARTNPMAPSPYWGDEPIWDSQTSMHNPMMDEKGRVWFTVARRARRRIRTSASKGSDHPSAKLFPLDSVQPPAVDVRSEDRQVHADQDLLPDPSPDLRRGRQQHAVDSAPAARAAASSAGSTARCSRRPATSRSRRAGRRSSSTPTATASATSMSSPNQPVDPTKDKRVAAALLRRRRQSGRRLDLGLGAGLSRAA